MASEIRVDKINSLSGVGTVTLSPTGVDIAGITTAATLKATTGIVTTLTATTGIVTTFEATTGNITTLRTPTGISTHFTADKISLPDSSDGSLCIGIGSDFKINHNGGHSYITEVGTGNLYIQGSNIIVRDAGTLDKYIEMTQNGAVDIYYDNSKKFETTSDGVTLTGNLTIPDKIIHSGDTDTEISFPAANTIDLQTASASRIRIASDGKIGFHATSPNTRFQVGNATFNGGHGMYSNDRVGMANHGSLTGLMLASTYNDAGVPEYGIVFVQGPDTSNYNCWSISPDGPAKGNSLSLHYGAQNTNIHILSNRKFEFDGDGDFRVAAGNVDVANGYGIDFSATSDVSGKTSELLDDYEEGTWSPVWSDATSGGTTSSSNQMHGRYTKIGRMVTAHFFTWGLPSQGTSNAIILQGLPYAAGEIGEIFGSVQAGYYNDGNTSTYNLGVFVTSGNTYGYLVWNNAGNNDVTSASFSGFINGYTNFTGTLTYLVA